MILFFVRGKIPDSDKLISCCYGHYRLSVGGRLSEEVAIIRGGGKPKLYPQSAHFNLSHSGGVTIVGFSHSEIGVDIEKIRDIDYKKFEFIKAEDREDFFKKWTERESYLKFTGQGLQNFKCDIPDDAYFEHFDVFDGYTVCVCAEKQNIIAYELLPEDIK